MQRFYQYMPIKIHFGFDLLEDETLFDMPYFKALIITSKDEALNDEPHLETLLKNLKKHQIKTLIFDWVPHPLNKETIEASSRMARDFNCDLIIAFGGGKVLDAAKLTARFAKEDFGLFDAWLKSGITPPFKHAPLGLVCVPRNLNFASSLNHKAFIHDKKHARFYRFKDDSLYPKVSLIDPGLFKTGDKTALIPSLMNTLVRAFKMIIHHKSLLHRMKSIEAMRLIIEHIAGLKKPQIEDKTLYYLSLAVFNLHHLNIAKTHLPLHQISDTIEGIHESLPHAVFLSYAFLPYLEYRLETAKPKDIDVIKRLFEHTPYFSNNLYVAFKNLFDALFLPAFNFKSYGIDLALVSDYMVHLKSVFPSFSTLKDEALYDIIEKTLLKGDDGA